MIKKIIMSMVIVFFLGIKLSSVEASTVPFSVEPVFGENQNKNIADYFDITVAPLEETTVQVNIMNNSESENQYEVLLENAFTNQNGIIDFHKEPMENGLIPDFTSLGSSVEKVTIAAKSSLKHPIQIKIPESTYDGVLLGGIRIRELSQETSQAQVKNTYSYLIPVKLHQGKQDFPDTLKSGKITIDTTHPLQSNLNLTLTNPQPDVLRNLQLSVQLKLKKDTSQDWQDIAEKEIQMAPLTTTEFPVSLDKPLNAGTYFVKVKGQTATFKQEWIEELVVDRQTAKTIKKQVSSEESNQFNWIAIVLFVVLLGQSFIFLKYWRKKKREKS